jgi:hypothetical protein
VVTYLLYLRSLQMVVSTRLGEHINSHSLQDNLLSAYRTCHSTETALLRVHHDIAYALDNNQCAVLVMLDLFEKSTTLQEMILAFPCSGFYQKILLGF